MLVNGGKTGRNPQNKEIKQLLIVADLTSLRCALLIPPPPTKKLQGIQKNKTNKNYLATFAYDLKFIR